MKKRNLVIAATGIASFIVLVVGGFLMNPICIAGGVAGIFITWAAVVNVKSAKSSHPYV